MDKVAVFGTADGGSIPSRGTIWEMANWFRNIFLITGFKFFATAVVNIFNHTSGFRIDFGMGFRRDCGTPPAALPKKSARTRQNLS